MLSRCLSCHRPFEPNQSLEHIRAGRRLAYDAARGRLWIVCESCGRWSLLPMQERWEALEELEKLTVDRGRLLAQTEHIALLRGEDLEIVRVGRARLAEQAWWRYGQELRTRRKRNQLLHGTEVAATVALSVATGGFIAWIWGGDALTSFDRWRRFGSNAWQGAERCDRCGWTLERIRFKHAKHLKLVPGRGEGEIGLHFGCRRCGVKRSDAGFRLEGVAAQHVLRRSLAYRNYSGGREKDITAATAAIDHAGSTEAFTRQLAERRTKLRDLSVRKRYTHGLALEIAMNDELERMLLEMELVDLERRWREEEEIASIIDGELTPMPLLRMLKEKLVNV